jgi:RNA polymerase sigma-70 factor (ECF subfamily)
MLRRSRRILYKVCLAFTDRQPDNVDDLYQEIVCNLWRGWPKFRGESDTSDWSSWGSYTRKPRVCTPEGCF